MNGTLYIVSTPIGNLEDITERAKRILAEADIIAAEDTRMARKLLGLLAIKNKTISNHKFNEKRQANDLINELKKGLNIALVSDAGTPCISDPGGALVAKAVESAIQVVGIGGVSAVIIALSVSGFVLDSFSFHGFFPRTENEIKKLIATIGGVVVFFESPKRIKKTLAVLMREMPATPLCLCNDLTKKYERIYRGTPEEIYTALQANPSAEKGEYTLVIQIPPLNEAAANNETTMEASLVDCMVQSNVTIKEAVGLCAKKNKKVTKKEWYAASLRLRAMFGDAND